MGEVNTIVTADLGIDIAKLNKAQMQWVLKEGQKYKNLYEDLLRSHGHEVPQITDTVVQWKRKYEDQLKENIKLRRQIRTARVDAACVLLTNRFENLLEVLKEF